MQPLFFITITLALALGTSGRDIASRIVGGSTAPDGQYPYQVALLAGIQICGGSIIGRRWILTAGHCFFGVHPKLITISAGTNLLFENGDRYHSDLLLFHPSLKNIALIRVTEDIVYNEKVQPIRLPESDFTAVDYPAVLTGWGSTSSSSAAPLAHYLQQINLTIISQESCKKIHDSITDTNICTFTKFGEGACRGDFGSPLVADGVQVGIAAWGKRCAIGYPDVYTRVWKFMDWINETIANNS